MGKSKCCLESFQTSDNKNYLIHFDNWFTSIKLLTTLPKRLIYTLGTIRQNRKTKCKIIEEKTLKTLGRGAYEEKNCCGRNRQENDQMVQH